MKHGKKILCLLLSIIMVFGLLPAAAIAAYDADLWKDYDGAISATTRNPPGTPGKNALNTWEFQKYIQDNIKVENGYVTWPTVDVPYLGNSDDPNSSLATTIPSFEIYLYQEESAGRPCVLTGKAFDNTTTSVSLSELASVTSMGSDLGYGGVTKVNNWSTNYNPASPYKVCIAFKNSNGGYAFSAKTADSYDLGSKDTWGKLTVKLGSLPTGLTCTSNNMNTTVTANGTYTATFTVDDYHMLGGYQSKLNGTSGILKNTGLTASIEGGKLKITGTVTKEIDLTSLTWPALTKTAAIVNGSVKQYDLRTAIDTAHSGDTVVMMKNPAVYATGTLQVGVTLKDTVGNTYNALEDKAELEIKSTGLVILNGGKLKVTAKDSTSTVSAGVKTGTSDTTTVTGSGEFIVTAAKGTGDGSEGNDKATVTIPTAGESVTTSTGLTFTAGANNATFPLDGSKLTNDGDSVKVDAGKTAEVEVGESTASIKVKVPAAGTTNTGTVTVTKGGDNNAAATVAVAKAGDKFTVGSKTYTAAEDGTAFAVDANGNVKLTSGSITLGDGESLTGAFSNKTIENPADSGNDAVTVVKKADCDEVTVPVGGKAIIDGKNYINGGESALKLKVTADGVSVISGTLTAEIADGGSTVGTVSGATILNPADSGNDALTVTSSGTKDTVTVPGGTGNKVSITKGDKTTEYTNGSNSADLVIDVTADGASLSSGSVKLDASKAIGVNGKTITNTSTTPIIVKKDDSSAVAVIELSDGQSFTDTDGNTYTANGSNAAFELDSAGNITLLAGSATVEPADGKTPTVNVRRATNHSDKYPVSGDKPFTVTVGDDDVKATVTVPTKGESVTSGDLTFTAGAANSTFPLDGSKLTNVGDSVVVGKDKADDTVITMQEADSSVDPALSEIKVTIPKENTGNTTVTKGQPTIVTIGADGDSFSVNGTVVPEAGFDTRAGEEYAINMTTGNIAKVTARLYDADGKLINAGSVYGMIGAATNGQTIKMVEPSENNIQNGLRDGVTLIDTEGNAYKAVGGIANIRIVGGTDDVNLDGGTLTVTPAADKTASVAVAKIPSSRNCTTVSGEAPFTVTAGKGNGSGAVKVPASGSADVRPDGWNSSVSVSVPAGGSDVTVSTVSGTPAKGKAEVASGKSVTIAGKDYTAAADGTAFAFDENGNVKLDSGKAKLNKDESILGGISGVEIKNTGAESIADPVIVEKAIGKDIVTVPAGGKVTIGGKEYTANSGEMKLEIDETGKVTLNSGKADFGKDTSLNLNGAEIKNTGNSALTMTENGSADTLDVAQGGSFTVGTGEVKAPGEDMRFTIESDGSLTANLTDGKSVTINGVTYTGGESGAALKLDKDGNLTVSGSYTAAVPGKTSYKVNGKVTRGGSPVADATVKLTQGGKETFRIASVTTDAQGDYEFAGVPSGVYNLVVTKDGQTVTKLVTVENGNVVMENIAMPTGSVSSIVDVLSGSPVGAMAGGLDAIASVDTTGGTVKYTLTVSGRAEESSIAAHEEAAGKTMLYLDIDLSKTVDGTPASFSNTRILEILLTFDTSNKRDIVVFHKDGDTVTALAKIDARPAADSFEEGTYYVGNGYVAVYTSKFSPYAIGYKEVVSSGGSGSSSTSSANVGKTQNGSVSVSPKSARKGETVTITVKPDEGYKLGTLTVTDKNGNKLALTKISDTQYTYAAPSGKVEVKAEFVKLGTDYSSCAKDGTCPIAAFADAKPTAWYHDGMHYCLDNGLMNGFGNGNIGPEHPTSRAQVVVMLWRLSGSPVVNYALDFDDVAEDTWYTEAIRWAKSTGVADGYGNGSFGPADTITREQIVTILYRYAQSNGYDVSVGESTNILSFADATTVSEFAFPAMQWACGSGMVNGAEGTDGTVTLLPQGDTSRAQMATILMRFCVEIAK